MRTTNIEKAVNLVTVRCCVCGSDQSVHIGSGYDFEYFTCPNVFQIGRCSGCENVYLNPRPDVSEFERIYPSTYHSLDFSEENYSFVHRIRSRLESGRLLRYCEGVPVGGRILDVGCGDGFHLQLLHKYQRMQWTLEGVDIDERAVIKAARGGLTIHHGSIEALNLPAESYDLVFCIQTIEHVAYPDRVFSAIFRVLKPGGRLVIVTDNTDTMDFNLFKDSYWGGYHFPRHWNLFNKRSLSILARKTGFEVAKIKTLVSPVNWVYSIHNFLVDRKAPQWLVNRFTLKSPISLGAFTLLDMFLQKCGKGALLNAYFVKPIDSR